MKLMFVGQENDPTEAAEVTEMGIVFPRGQAVSVPGDVFEQLSPNPAFRAVPGRKAAAPVEPVSSEGTE